VRSCSAFLDQIQIGFHMSEQTNWIFAAKSLADQVEELLEAFLCALLANPEQSGKAGVDLVTSVR